MRIVNDLRSNVNCNFTLALTQSQHIYFGQYPLAATSYFNPIPENIDSSYLLSYFYDFHTQQPNCIGDIFVGVGTKFCKIESTLYYQGTKLLC